MSASNSNKAPVWFWIVSIIALIWNGMGINAYLQQAYNTDSYRAMYTDEQLAIAENLPAFVTAAFALAVFGGLIGSILLLLRKKLATLIFTLSLLAVLVQMGYLLINGYASNILMSVMIIALALVLVWFSRVSAAKGWIK